MNLKLIPIIAVSLLLGLGIGCIPILNQHLHYNIWFFIPISGLLFGALLGLLQYFLGYVINFSIRGASLLIIIASSIMSYFLIDLGIFLSTSVQISGVKELTDGTYRLSELSTFSEYLKFRLGSSGIGFIYGPDVSILKLGSVGTKISYFVDFIGVVIGTLAPLSYFSGKHPFCNQCNKFKKSINKYQLYFSSKSSILDDILSKIEELVEASSLEPTIVYFKELYSEYSQNKGDIKLIIDQRACPSCNEISIVCRIYQKEAYEWKSLKDLSFSFKQPNNL